MASYYGDLNDPRIIRLRRSGKISKSAGALLLAACYAVLALFQCCPVHRLPCSDFTTSACCDTNFTGGNLTYKMYVCSDKHLDEVACERAQSFRPFLGVPPLTKTGLYDVTCAGVVFIAVVIYAAGRMGHVSDGFILNNEVPHGSGLDDAGLDLVFGSRLQKIKTIGLTLFIVARIALNYHTAYSNYEALPPRDAYEPLNEAKHIVAFVEYRGFVVFVFSAASAILGASCHPGDRAQGYFY